MECICLSKADDLHLLPNKDRYCKEHDKYWVVHVGRKRGIVRSAVEAVDSNG